MPYFKRDRRPELRESVAEAQTFLQRYSGQGWLSAWLTSASDQAELEELDQRLREAMTGFFQVNLLCRAFVNVCSF